MITVNLRYMGTNGNARKFAEEMMASGTVGKIRADEGNLRYAISSGVNTYLSGSA